MPRPGASCACSPKPNSPPHTRAPHEGHAPPYALPMEIVDRGDDSGDGPVQIAFADTREEAALIRGLLREAKIKSIARQAGVEGGIGTSSLLTRSSRRHLRPPARTRPPPAP